MSLFGLMYLAYQGLNVLVLAPLMALLAALFHVGTPLMATYTQIFMPALGNYLFKYFPLFMLGAIFGRLMNDSGAAITIGRWITRRLGEKQAILATVLSCAVLTYGGVSLFVVAFCIYPIAAALFKVADVPKRLIPGSIALGSFTFTMTALPGTPSIQNAIPMPYFGTTTFAAPGLGVIAAIIMFLGGMIWLNRRAKLAKEKGEGYLPANEKDIALEQDARKEFPSIWVAFLPLVIVLALNYLFSDVVLPMLDHSYLLEKKYGGVTSQKVIGLWALVASLAISIIVLLIVMRNYLSAKLKSVNQGTMESLLPIFNTASEVGYGATIAALSSFALIKTKILGIFPEYPLISEAVAINVLAGITGSASGGLSIALEALGSTYLSLAEAANISPELLHRVATLSCGGFDTLPHNGAVITLLGICGLTHKKSYFDIFTIAVALPVISTAVVVVLGTAVGSF